MYLLNESLNAFLISNVTNVSLNVCYASLFIVGEAALEGSLVDVIEDNGLRSCLNEGLGDVETDTVGRACNPRVLSLQGEVL